MYNMYKNCTSSLIEYVFIVSGSRQLRLHFCGVPITLTVVSIKNSAEYYIYLCNPLKLLRFPLSWWLIYSALYFWNFSHNSCPVIYTRRVYEWITAITAVLVACDIFTAKRELFRSLHISLHQCALSCRSYSLNIL